MTDKPDPVNEPPESQPTAPLSADAGVPAAAPETARGAAGEQATPQPAHSGAGAPPPPNVRRAPHTTRTWIAAVVAAVLLVGGGVGGYAIGAADHHRDNGPARHQDGFRGDLPDRGGDGPWNR